MGVETEKGIFEEKLSKAWACKWIRFTEIDKKRKRRTQREREREREGTESERKERILEEMIAC